ncbi:hypothetical protein FA15DRAFT_704327 [Coprinopsis marcescibilis]|uniref:Uncharacterized protein n=1 Tax=Coprinopsis marcescibilis TaxID=230819 RepID=A0A5C3KWJ5_COPMA|nr:hypothetical protein FA15DRAFT_704327 [Coprinopsis marcescibilis]
MPPPPNCLPLKILSRMIEYLVAKHEFILKPDPSDLTVNGPFAQLLPCQEQFINDCAFYAQEAVEAGRGLEFIQEVLFKFFTCWEVCNGQFWVTRGKIEERLEVIVHKLNRAFYEHQAILPDVSWKMMLAVWTWDQWEELAGPLCKCYLESPRPIPLPTISNTPKEEESDESEATDATENNAETDMTEDETDTGVAEGEADTEVAGGEANTEVARTESDIWLQDALDAGTFSNTDTEGLFETMKEHHRIKSQTYRRMPYRPFNPRC